MSETQTDLRRTDETQAELTRLRAEVERLETELQMWRGAADDRRGFVVRPKADPMF